MATSIQVNVRELKAKATMIIRQVEAGVRVTVTKRGRTVALIESVPGLASEPSTVASDSIYDTLRRRIESRVPAARGATPAERAREFARISRKMTRGLPYQNWRDMDRAVKGDRHRLSRQ